MVEMAQRADCVCIRLQRWASQQLAKAGRQMVVDERAVHYYLVLCDASTASRQTGRREDLWAAGLLHYLGPAIRERTLATLLGLKTTKSVKSEQAIPRPSTPGRRPTARGPRTKDEARRNNSV